MPMYGERLAAAMSRAVVTILWHAAWRAALPWRRVLRQLPQPAVMVGAAAGALATPLALLLNRIRPLFMAKAGVTAAVGALLASATTAAVGATPAVATPTPATSLDGPRCCRATTAAAMAGAAAGALATPLALLLNRIRPLFMAKAGITAVTRRVRATETVTIIGKCFASPGIT